MMAVVVMMMRAAVINRCRMVDDRCGGVNHRGWRVDNRRGLIDDRMLDHDGLRWLGINYSGAWLLHYDLLHWLLHDHGSRLIDNGWRIDVDRRW